MENPVVWFSSLAVQRLQYPKVIKFARLLLITVVAMESANFLNITQ